MAGRPLRRARERMRRNGLPAAPPTEPVRGWVVVTVGVGRPYQGSSKFVQEAKPAFYPCGDQLEGLFKHMNSGALMVAWARPMSEADYYVWQLAGSRGRSTPLMDELEEACLRVEKMLSDHQFGTAAQARAGLEANHFAWDAEMSGLVFHEWVKLGLVNAE